MQAAPDIWSLALSPGQIDPNALMEAIEAQVASGDLDFRTRLLIRDSIRALEQNCGKDRVIAWLNSGAHGEKIRTIQLEPLGDAGFASLPHRVMEPTKPDAVIAFLRELSLSIQKPTKMFIGGSIALILAHSLSRRTEDIDVVDEIPAELRNQHRLLEQLATRYGLRLAHFQSHYLPSGWQARLRSVGVFGKLEAYAIDVYDVFLSKLFSIREKDKDDLLELAQKLDREILTRRLIDSAAALRKEPNLEQAAGRNWYILFGDPLPSGSKLP